VFGLQDGFLVDVDGNICLTSAQEGGCVDEPGEYTLARPRQQEEGHRPGK